MKRGIRKDRKRASHNTPDHCIRREGGGDVVLECVDEVIQIRLKNTQKPETDESDAEHGTYPQDGGE